MKLRDVLPKEFFAEHPDSKVNDFLNERIIETVDGCEKRWIGKERYVYTWWILANGKAIGWNENPSRGWSFPIVSFKCRK